MDNIYTLMELPQDCFSLAGGKGGTLALLQQAKYPIPNGFIILPVAFDDDGLRVTVWDEVLNHLHILRHGKKDMLVAVRSSANSEDSSTVSFAGEFETVLNISQDEEVFKAINTVYQSRLGERAEAYSSMQGIKDGHTMAVVVQEMVPAEYAGILFTANPVTGSDTQMLGSFVSGLGDKLVSGIVDGERFSLSRPNGRFEGPDILRPFARKLFRLCKKLESELGSFQDIEWAIANGKLYLLQSRPITTMQSFNPMTGEWNDSYLGDFLWSSTNVGEAMP